MRADGLHLLDSRSKAPGPMYCTTLKIESTQQQLSSPRIAPGRVPEYTPIRIARAMCRDCLLLPRKSDAARDFRPVSQ
jgi:hypothetical protein